MVARSVSGEHRGLPPRSNHDKLRWSWFLIAPFVKIVVVATAIGVVVGSATVAALVAGLLMSALYLWRNHLLPRRPRRRKQR